MMFSSVIFLWTNYLCLFSQGWRVQEKSILRHFVWLYNITDFPTVQYDFIFFNSTTKTAVPQWHRPGVPAKALIQKWDGNTFCDTTWTTEPYIHICTLTRGRGAKNQTRYHYIWSISAVFTRAYVGAWSTNQRQTPLTLQSYLYT